MPKYYCDYCDVFLTHDSTSVRKAHNSGRNHIQNVRDYYAAMGHDKAQDIIDQITNSYANAPPGGMMGSGPPPMRMGPGFMGAPGPGGLPPPGMHGGIGGGPPMMNGGYRPNQPPPFFQQQQQQQQPNTSHLGHHQPPPHQSSPGGPGLPFRPPFNPNQPQPSSPYGAPPQQNGYAGSPSQYNNHQQPPHMMGAPGGFRPPPPNFNGGGGGGFPPPQNGMGGGPPPPSGGPGGAGGYPGQAAPYAPGGGAGLRINPDRLRMLGNGGGQ